MSMSLGDRSNPTRFCVCDCDRACIGRLPVGRLFLAVGRAVLWGNGWDDEGKACFKLAEFPGLLIKRRDSMASFSRTF